MKNELTNSTTQNEALQAYLKANNFYLDDISDDHIITVYRGDFPVARFNSTTCSPGQIIEILKAFEHTEAFHVDFTERRE